MSIRNCLFFLLLLICGASGAYAQPITGFSPARAGTEAGIEQLFLKLPNSPQYAAHLEKLTAEPHPAGSEENNRVADYMAATMEKAGLRVERFPYDIYLPKGPGEVEIAIVTPSRLPLNNQEDILPEDPYSSDPRITHGWNSYSGSGDVTAQVVYANYGTREDFARLTRLGIDVKGKIVLARYGGNFRGYKAKYAEAAGAAGLLIFSDPADAGYMRGLVYPEGKYFNESTIQRGSILTLDWTGDPLTPFEPALPLDGPVKVKRLDPKEVPFHTIPVAPIGYGAAKEIIARMTGAAVPQGWQGGLPYTYRLEGGKTLTVRLRVEQPKDFVRIQNVIGTIEGSEAPDEWIIIGSHYDAWVHGATDPNSGTAMLLSLADALGELVKQGHRPRRTIKIAHWDAEEHGILGSTEWVEQFRDELDRKAVAYFNADGNCSGLSFNGASSPSLKQLLLDASRVTPYPIGQKTVYEHWLEQASDKAKGPSVGNLGGGSDHLPFYAHVGIPSLSAGMGGPTMYHSAYDNFHWYRSVGDPGFLSGPTVTRVFGIMALRLANADVIPFDVVRYANDLETHLESAAKQINTYSPDFSVQEMKPVIQTLRQNAQAFDQRLRERLEKGKLSTGLAQQLNRKLLRLERAFIDPQGMAYGAWYRSLYASSDPYSGYASWMLPGFLYEASLESTSNLPLLTDRYRNAFLRLNEEVVGLRKMVE